MRYRRVEFIAESEHLRGHTGGFAWKSRQYNAVWPEPTDKTGCQQLVGYALKPINAREVSEAALVAPITEDEKKFVRSKIKEELDGMLLRGSNVGWVVLQTPGQADYAMIAWPRTHRSSLTCVKIMTEHYAEKPETKTPIAQVAPLAKSKPKYPEPVLLEGESIEKYEGSCV